MTNICKTTKKISAAAMIISTILQFHYSAVAQDASTALVSRREIIEPNAEDNVLSVRGRQALKAMRASHRGAPSRVVKLNLSSLNGSLISIVTPDGREILFSGSIVSSTDGTKVWRGHTNDKQHSIWIAYSNTGAAASITGVERNYSINQLSEDNSYLFVETKKCCTKEEVDEHGIGQPKDMRHPQWVNSLDIGK